MRDSAALGSRTGVLASRRPEGLPVVGAEQAYIAFIAVVRSGVGRAECLLGDAWPYAVLAKPFRSLAVLTSLTVGLSVMRCERRLKGSSGSLGDVALNTRWSRPDPHEGAESR
jgi:hypothetical protein